MLKIEEDKDNFFTVKLSLAADAEVLHPILSFQGLLAQYAGRLHHEEDSNPILYAYAVEGLKRPPAMLTSYLESLDSFLGATFFDGCKPDDDPWFINQDPTLVQQIQRLLSSKQSPARILVQAPPASGKTSLLQALVRVEAARPKNPEFYPIIMNGGRYKEDMANGRSKQEVIAKINDAIAKAQKEQSAPIVLVIDDGQHLYPVLDALSKDRRDVHLIVAASYYLPVSDPSTQHASSIALVQMSSL